MAREEKDIVIKVPQCGCLITYYWRSGWNTGHLKPCAEHAKKSAYNMAKRDEMMEAARQTKNELLRRQGTTPGTAFVDLLLAAMMDACINGKLTQLKTTITPDDSKPPMLVRIIVVPEEMEHNWPQNAPLGTDPTTIN